MSVLPTLLLLSALALRLASGPTASVSYLVLAIFALMGRAQAIQALALSWLFTMLSSGIAPVASAAAVGRYAVLAGAALSVLARSDLPRGREWASWPIQATLLLGLFFAVHAILFSPLVDVSVLKAFSWAVAMATIFSAWKGLSQDESFVVTTRLFGGLVLILLVSLPLLGTPLGFLRNGTGFQGILNHPQNFGPTMALLGAMAVGRMVGRPRPSWLLVWLVVVCLALILASESRTAGLAMIFGIASLIVVVPFITRQSIRQAFPGLINFPLYLVLLATLAGVLTSGPGLQARLADYFTKRSEAETLVDAYDKSRGRLIEDMYDNIRKHTWAGIGFGIASNPSEMVISYDPVTGLPLGASIEKGVLPLAVLEEVGIPGFVLVMLWVVMLVRRTTGPASVAVILTALFLNLGESTLFSPGGMGLLSMVLLGWAVSSKEKTNRST